ncbi:hypothetical protein SAMN05216389_101220 [Oceanobacillus limi]|uniref:Uncharacterized protein n=1 Tax=Oceanobacillus limi TaxID=930131 RepID=A0A1H9Y6P9_9BACI|nr:hypothetical protein [Oceanobacillus limi]SES64396.1 hypothetical protein SAMN05216389_101220 [Oceanobacillus limi]
MSEEKKQTNAKERFGKVKAYQEINKEISTENEVKKQRPTPQPKDFDEIEY